jgi:hypothetical protein
MIPALPLFLRLPERIKGLMLMLCLKGAEERHYAEKLRTRDEGSFHCFLCYPGGGPACFYPYVHLAVSHSVVIYTHYADYALSQPCGFMDAVFDG